MVPRAFTAIVTGPNHLIGDKAQVEQYRAGTVSELPPWYAEWSDMLPHWHLAILESPYDVGDFFRGAIRDPLTPRVGFVTNSKLSLGCGYVAGVEQRESTSAYRRDRALDEQVVEAERTHLEHIRKQRRKRAQTQAEANAAAEDAADVTALPVGISPRTQLRDALLRHSGTPIPRYGLCCPDCGRRFLTAQFAPASARQLKSLGLAEVACEWCGAKLGQMTRERDNVQDRAHPLWDSPAWTTHYYDTDGNRAIPWGERPISNPRYPLGLLIGKRYKGMVDVYISDELHECKGAKTAIGRAFGAMITAAHRTVGLTGTLFGGKASDVYSLLLRMGNVPVLQQYGWNNEPRFVQDVGVVDTITREITRTDEAGHFSGKSTTATTVQERPGITAGLATILQNQGVSVLLRHMGFRLVNYTEDLITLDLPGDLAYDYKQLEDAGKAIISFAGNDALGSYLQATLLYPYAPWMPKTICSRRKDATYTALSYTADLVLPHHEWLAEYCTQESRDGRQVLVYCEHTSTDDLMPDIADKISYLAAERHGVALKVATLRSTTVKPGERRAWFTAREQDGTNVVLCNPRLVKTGLNLIGWPSIIVLEPVYSLFTLAQAKRRAFRPTQTRDCTVTYVCYSATMSERAISIVARKAAAAAILNGDDLENGLMEFDASMSLLQELARLVTAGEQDTVNADVQAMLQAGAAALKADLERGTADMIGAIDTLELPTPAIELPIPVQPVLADAPQAAVPARSKPVFGDTSLLRKPGANIKARKTTLLTLTAMDAPVQMDLWSALLSSTIQPQTEQRSLFE